ncbi:TPA: gamma-glutamyltransferase [Stenotrophomonas maltophilia]|nr:gamma-glutamyltransferase [Stenotrophomonas maltophilia]HEL5027939.1 gamma-glutamyltransferase [Stenotrophomonas maltophilia]
MIDFGFDVQQAIEAPRWLMGRTWGTASSSLLLESRISDETTRELRLRGQPRGHRPSLGGLAGPRPGDPDRPPHRLLRRRCRPARGWGGDEVLTRRVRPSG